ncbi:MAG: hypothetical protein ACI9NC_003724, partial [Verrucomicrobiales bacterium]
RIQAGIIGFGGHFPELRRESPRFQMLHPLIDSTIVSLNHEQY